MLNRPTFGGHINRSEPFLLLFKLDLRYRILAVLVGD